MSLLTDGFSTTIELAEAPSGFYLIIPEKAVTPPSLEGGGKIDNTSMRNTVVRTSSPKKLLDVGDCTLTVQYDPTGLTAMKALMLVNQLITLTFPDLTTWQFWAFVDSFTPSENAEGEEPTAEITIVTTNQNDSGVETAPVIGT